MPAGVTAIDKHPYAPLRRFPAAAATDAPGMPPLDTFGRVAGSPPSNPATQPWTDDFVPTYTAFFPEYWLTGIQTETEIRDLSPYTTLIYGVPHGRYTHPPGGRPPTMWVTEFNMDPTGTGMSQAAIAHMQAKAVLRFLVSWVNKGVAAVDFYAAKMAPLALVSSRSSPQLMRAMAPTRAPPRGADDAGDEPTGRRVCGCTAARQNAAPEPPANRGLLRPRPV